MKKSILLSALCLLSCGGMYGQNLTGPVGIDVASPTAKLQIVNNGAATLRVGITSNRANTYTQILNSLAVIGDDNQAISVIGATAWDHFNNGNNPSWAGTFLQHTGTAVTGNRNGVAAANQGALVFQNVQNGVIATNGQANIHIAPVNTVSTSFLWNGYVGVGTTNPATKLQVNDGHISTTSNNGLNGFVKLWNDNAFMWKGGSVNGDMRFGSAATLGGGNWSEKMRITDAGNLGIGIQAPRSKLDVWGGALSITGADENGTLVAGAQGGIAYIGTNALTNGIGIHPNGNIGIGTNQIQGAGFNLYVQKGIRTRKVKVDQAVWADYVFLPSYKLMPLPQVEAFIKQHGHLPEVPSAAEVAANGVDLGDTQTLLLKKIEELTLYMIELKKENEEIKAELKTIKRGK